jgi:hypothetical protein
MRNYAALTMEETAASSVEDDADNIVTPIPPEAPPVTLHPVHGRPVARWIYRTADGQPAFHVCRFEPTGGRKQILPQTLWRDLGGNLHWGWKAAAAPRPFIIWIRSPLTLTR